MGVASLWMRPVSVIRVEASRVIARPTDEVWAYVTNLGNMPSWDPGLVAVRWQAPMRTGTRVEMDDASRILRLVGRIVPPVFSVTHYEDGRSFALSLSRGASSMKTVYALEALGPASTKVTRSFSFDGRGIWRLFELATRRRAIRDREAEVENLKFVLERPPETPTR
jgi:uncharacterized protein YndB with AHSA1/START domain